MLKIKRTGNRDITSLLGTLSDILPPSRVDEDNLIYTFMAMTRRNPIKNSLLKAYKGM
jgi:hypothetical protein